MRRHRSQTTLEEHVKMTTQNTHVSEAAPLVVSPRVACVMLDIGTTRLYQLIGTGELDSYLDGRVRRITVDSIRRRIARLLAASGHPSHSPRRKRGRPRKLPSAEPGSAIKSEVAQSPTLRQQPPHITTARGGGSRLAASAAIGR